MIQEAPSVETAPATVDLFEEMRQSGVMAVLEELDRELIGIKPVKKRIRETAALLVDRARQRLGLTHESPTLHMSSPATQALERPPSPARWLVFCTASVTRDDLVDQYIGHTAPKTKDVLNRAMGGVLFIDEAYYLYRPDNERDHGQEAMEILLQVMENNRDDLVVVLAGYADRMERVFESNPGFRSRIAHHVEFPDYTDEELLQIAVTMLAAQNHQMDHGALMALWEYIDFRRRQPHFANARSIHNALDRARLRQASRLLESNAGPLDAAALSAIHEADIRASRVFRGSLATEQERSRNFVISSHAKPQSFDSHEER